MPDYRKIAAKDARKYHIPVQAFLRQIQQESGFNPNARSGAGAQGIAQIVPRYHPGVNPYNPVQALDYAARWMGQLEHKYGNIRDALSVYNSGRPWSVGKGIPETSDYVAKILGGANIPVGGGSPQKGSQSVRGALASTSRQVPNPSYGSAGRNAFVQALLGGSDILDAVMQQVQTPMGSPTLTRFSQSKPLTSTNHLSTSLSASPQTGRFPGIAELLHEGVGGPTHSTGEHIHVASTNPGTMLRVLALAKTLGLAERENPYVDPVDPVHARNSYHYRTFPGVYHGRRLGEATDFSGSEAAMMALYRRLQAKR